jgi:hypothetical protein
VPPFRRRVRQLKELGLTESLEIGYRLPPRRSRGTGAPRQRCALRRAAQTRLATGDNATYIPFPFEIRAASSSV